eukprot:jgi/Mesvir1/2805/Mv25443-RA.1
MRMMLHRLRAALDPHLGESQMGFRRGRNTVMAVFVARRLMEEVRRLPPDSLPLVFIFVDYIRKAFDTVLWEALWAILALDRVPPAFIAAIRRLYEGSQAVVRGTAEGTTPPFPLHHGVWQGCVLSPYLFIIVVDHVMRRARARFTALKGLEPGLDILNVKEHGGVRPGYRLADLIYADDTTLIESPEHIQTWLDCLGLEARAVPGLEISVKTEAMVIGASSKPPLPRLLDGTEVPFRDRFKLLGSWLPDTADDVDTRIGLAWAKLRSLTPYWRSKGLNGHRKRMLFKVLVLTVLTYGAEAWTLPPKLAARLDGTVYRMLRQVLNVGFFRASVIRVFVPWHAPCFGRD